MEDQGPSAHYNLQLAYYVTHTLTFAKAVVVDGWIIFFSPSTWDSGGTGHTRSPRCQMSLSFLNTNNIGPLRWKREIPTPKSPKIFFQKRCTGVMGPADQSHRDFMPSSRARGDLQVSDLSLARHLPNAGVGVVNLDFKTPGLTIHRVICREPIVHYLPEDTII